MKHRWPQRVAQGALLLCVASACAGSAASRQATSPAAAPVGIATFADSAALVARVEALGAQAGAGGHWLGWVVGRPPDSVSVELLEATLPPALTSSLSQVVTASLVPRGAGERTNVVLEIEPGAPARVAARRAVGVRPELLNQESVIAAYARAAGPHARSAEVVVRMRVTTAGAVDTAFVHQSSGSASLDAAAWRAALTTRFRPGTIEGHPVRMWMEIPMVYRGL